MCLLCFVEHVNNTPLCISLNKYDQLANLCTIPHLPKIVSRFSCCAQVATVEDPASARLGESVYKFMPRSVIGNWQDAMRIELIRLQGSHHSPLSLHNRLDTLLHLPLHKVHTLTNRDSASGMLRNTASCSYRGTATPHSRGYNVQQSHRDACIMSYNLSVRVMWPSRLAACLTATTGCFMAGMLHQGLPDVTITLANSHLSMVCLCCSLFPYMAPWDLALHVAAAEAALHCTVAAGYLADLVTMPRLAVHTGLT